MGARTQTTLRNVGDTPLGQYNTGNGWIMQNGTGLESGPGWLQMSEACDYIEFRPDSLGPLEFETTQHGYRYESGKGTLILPDGTIREFP